MLLADNFNLANHPVQGHVAHLWPSSTNITVVTREPNFSDILLFIFVVDTLVVGIFDHFLDILRKQGRLELDTVLVDSHGMTDVVCSSSHLDWGRRISLDNCNRVDAVPDTEEEDLDVLVRVRIRIGAISPAEGLTESLDFLSRSDRLGACLMELLLVVAVKLAKNLDDIGIRVSATEDISGSVEAKNKFDMFVGVDSLLNVRIGGVGHLGKAGRIQEVRRFTSCGGSKTLIAFYHRIPWTTELHLRDISLASTIHSPFITIAHLSSRKASTYRAVEAFGGSDPGQ
ncbi:hypothetical protein HG530_015097 [Fusarium avenaceum]|nr:hypothetical protein HG530_015097 [Fusarium avenaceum]